MKKNEGEVPQYYVEGNHEAIISPAVFEMVQDELAKRANGGARYSGVSIFSNKIKCADCGGFFGAKAKYDETTAAISAKEAQSARLEAFIKMLKEQDGIIKEFDVSLWGSMVECVTVGRDKKMAITFRDGTEIDA